ncbi:MAG: DUF4160 domain-containing protein [Verrucomicrobiales bacterium]
MMHLREHPPAHFHAIYGEFEAMIEIESLQVIEGRLPRHAASLVSRWAGLYRQDLMSAWQQIQTGQLPQPIPPLD